uniref:RNase H type-1 domain-containing protein n=1 Tax=Megaselia scalaris TaxID=36166 RepID=T1GVS6_MEGSC
GLKNILFCFAILSFPFVDEFIHFTASCSALGLRNLKIWSEKSYDHAALSLSSKIVFGSIIPLVNFEQKFSVEVLDREEWLYFSREPVSDINIFTDGSKSRGGGRIVVHNLFDVPERLCSPSRAQTKDRQLGTSANSAFKEMNEAKTYTNMLFENT